MCPGHLAIEHERLFGAGDRCVEFEPVIVQYAEVVVGVRIRWRQLNRAPAGDQGVIVAVELAVDLAQIAVKQRDSGQQRDGALDQLHRLREMAPAERNDAEEIQGAGAVGRRREDSVEHCLGFIEPALLLVLAGKREELAQLVLGRGRRYLTLGKCWSRPGIA